MDDLGVRWGSCTAEGAITLHWAIMQLSPDLIDYVLVHELCHLKEPGHGPAFRREMTLALPDFTQREAWFEREEPYLWRGATR